MYKFIILRIPLSILLCCFSVLETFGQTSSLVSLKLLFDSNFDKELAQVIVEDLESNFSLDVESLGYETFTDGFIQLDSIVNGLNLLNDLKEYKGETSSKHIIITDKLLTLNGNSSLLLRGFSKIGEDFAIVSSKRIEQESLAFELDYRNQLGKAVKHEFLHLIGLPHCESNNKCIMISAFPESNFHQSKSAVCKSCFLRIDSLQDVQIQLKEQFIMEDF